MAKTDTILSYLISLCSVDQEHTSVSFLQYINSHSRALMHQSRGYIEFRQFLTIPSEWFFARLRSDCQVCLQLKVSMWNADFLQRKWTCQPLHRSTCLSPLKLTCLPLAKLPNAMLKWSTSDQQQNTVRKPSRLSNTGVSGPELCVASVYTSFQVLICDHCLLLAL